MVLLRLIFLGAVILAAGCEPSLEVPNAAKQHYPAFIKDSSDRRAKAEREWRRLLDAYKVPQTPPDLYPITYTPRSLLGVSGGIRIVGDRPEPGSEDAILRDAFRGFIDRWRELLGADTASLSLVAADESAGIRRLTYRQASYPYPVAGSYGEMVAVVNADGRLMQLDDRLIPVVELPVRPAIEREVAAATLLGQTFTYADIAGRPQRVTIVGREEVSVRRAVVFPIEKGDALEIHLAWEVVAGKSLTWTVYVDSVTGDQLRAVQNFAT